MRSWWENGKGQEPHHGLWQIDNDTPAAPDPHMNTTDTIAAISSAVGVAARMIVRVSGERAFAIAAEVGMSEVQGGVVRCDVFPGVGAWVYCFRHGHSYTGEDLVEFHIPGSPVVARMLLDELLRRGARLAEAGEFTAR